MWPRANGGRSRRVEAHCRLKIPSALPTIPIVAPLPSDRKNGEKFCAIPRTRRFGSDKRRGAPWPQTRDDLRGLSPKRRRKGSAGGVALLGREPGQSGEEVRGLPGLGVPAYAVALHARDENELPGRSCDDRRIEGTRGAGRRFDPRLSRRLALDSHGRNHVVRGGQVCRDVSDVEWSAH